MEISRTRTQPPPDVDCSIPNHRLHSAEAHLKLVVNTNRRERPHWWLFTEAGRPQRELLEQLGWWTA